MAPGALPPPPDNLNDLELPIAVVSQEWFRSHPGNRSPIHYGRAVRYRLDDPDGSYGVLYVAQDPFGAFVETFGQLMSAPTAAPRQITSGQLQSKTLSRIVCHRSLRLADLTGPGLARVGADARHHRNALERLRVRRGLVVSVPFAKGTPSQLTISRKLIPRA